MNIIYMHSIRHTSREKTNISMGYCKKDITPVHQQCSDVLLALTRPYSNWLDCDSVTMHHGNALTDVSNFSTANHAIPSTIAFRAIKKKHNDIFEHQYAKYIIFVNQSLICRDSLTIWCLCAFFIILLQFYVKIFLFLQKLAAVPEVSVVLCILCMNLFVINV